MTDYSDDGLLLDGPSDPDAQATVTDYIDYTEFLPADLVRSLTLIRGLDERYLDSAQSVHELTKTFGQLPNLPADVRPSAQTLRRDISRKLDRALEARESAYAEACRLYDVVDSHFNRLGRIKQKLHTLPKPSTEPPPTQPVKHTRTGRRHTAGPSTTRITLRVDGQDKGRNAAQKSRTRRSLGSGNLARFNPDSPIASTEHSDDEEDSKPEPSVSPADREAPVTSARKKDKQGRRRTVAAATASTPAMSTSSALALLRPPTDDAKPGSPDMPWLRLTEWEMTNLRRKMKKNSVWQPSEVMIHRELAIRGRGWEAYRTAKEAAERNGEEFVDCDDIMNTYIPGQLTRRGEGMKDFGPPTETKLSNRGMKLNEAKRLKRENMAREQAAAAAESERSKRPGEQSNLVGQTAASAVLSKGKPTRATRKRKVEEDFAVQAGAQADAEADTALRSSTKRQKTGKEVVSGTVAAAGPSDVKKSPRLPSPTAPRRTSTRAASSATSLQRPPSAPKNVNTPTPPATRPSSRRLSAAFIAVPSVAASRDLRRKSATPARKTPNPEAAPSRRRKRPAPGPVSSGEDGGAAVSYGRRKAKPIQKKASVPRDQEQQESTARPNHGFRIDEDGVREEIDPNEPRYCVCGDVSFGTMICCENPDVCFLRLYLCLLR